MKAASVVAPQLPSTLREELLAAQWRLPRTIAVLTQGHARPSRRRDDVDAVCLRPRHPCAP